MNATQPTQKTPAPTRPKERRVRVYPTIRLAVRNRLLEYCAHHGTSERDAIELAIVKLLDEAGDGARIDAWRAQFDLALEAERECHEVERERQRLQWSEMRRDIDGLLSERSDRPLRSGTTAPDETRSRAADARQRAAAALAPAPRAPVALAPAAPAAGREPLLAQYAREVAGYQTLERLGPITILQHASRPRDRVAITVDAAGNSSYTAIPSYQPRGKDELLEVAQARLRFALAASFDKGSAEEFVGYCARQLGVEEPTGEQARLALRAWSDERKDSSLQNKSAPKKPW